MKNIKILLSIFLVITICLTSCNDGWLYVGDLYSSTNTKLKLYYKVVNTTTIYQIKDPNHNKYLVEKNKSFGKKLIRKSNGKVEENYRYRFKYSAGDYVFNLPSDDITEELIQLDAKDWKFIKIVSLYCIDRKSLSGLVGKSANLYWRQCDGKYMVIPSSSSEKYYDYNLKKEMCFESNNSREIIVKEELHNIEYQSVWIGKGTITENKTFTHKAAEYSLNLYK